VIQKKICLVGVFATGKTSLVRQFVYSKFTDKYHSTVGVKIDRKEVALRDGAVNLVLWDLEGRDGHGDVRPSYLRGAAGIIYVADGTRPGTFEQIFELRALADKTIGTVPSVFAINKADLTEEWKIEDRQIEALDASKWHALRTSAKTGEGVEDAFHWLATAMVGGGAT
jgi:small GTP-binding protein